MENWEAFVAQQQMDRELSRKSFKTDAAIAMSWSPEREKWLKDRYPAAVWVEPLKSTEYLASKL